MSGVHTGMTNTRNTPDRGAGAGVPDAGAALAAAAGERRRRAAPGGEGIERDLEVLEDATVSLITERRVSRPWGLAGGEAGAAGGELAAARRRRGRAERLPDKCTIRLEAGDVLRMLTPGGGGWGTSSEE